MKRRVPSPAPHLPPRKEDADLFAGQIVPVMRPIWTRCVRLWFVGAGYPPTSGYFADIPGSGGAAVNHLVAKPPRQSLQLSP